MKKTLVSLLVVSMLATPAHAFNLDSAFSSLTGGSTVAYNEPGHYSNSARNNFVLGGVDARLPRKKTTLMSITPPTLNAGCQGISAHFGGFSFVSGEQIEQLINSIAANATGMVVSLVLKTLCPLCQGVIEAMTHMAQQASKMSIDSCQVGSNLLSSAGSLFGADPNSAGDTAGTVCGRRVANGGQYQDYLDGMTQACNTVSGAVAELEKFTAKPAPANSPTTATGDREILDVGNRTWEALKAIGYGGKDDESIAARTLLMNMIGTRVVTAKNEDGSAREAPLMYPPALAPDRLMDLYMCGVSEWTGSLESTQYGAASLVCGSTQARRATGAEEIWSCDHEPDKCLYPKVVKVGELKGLQGAGFLYRVADLLHRAADDIRMERPLRDPELISLLERVPYPVYQVINVAAIYPVASKDLIDSTSAIIAESMAQTMFEDFARNSRTTLGPTNFNQQDMLRIQAAMESFTTTLAQRKSLIASRIATQEMMMENIRTLNLAIQKEVMGSEMLGTSKFANVVTESVAETNR